MRYFSIKIRKFNLLSVVAFIVIVFGIFNTWLWRGYDSWTDFDPQRREVEIHYHIITTVSPFYSSIIVDGKLSNMFWFVNFETSLAGAIILSTSFLSIFVYKKKYIKLLLNFISLIMVVFFFLSFGGRGLGIGSITYLGDGFRITMIGVTLMFISALFDLIS